MTTNSGTAPSLMDRLRAARVGQDRRISEIMVRVKRRYVLSAHDDLLGAALDGLYADMMEADMAKADGARGNVGRLGEACALRVLGESGVGKTRSLERAFLTRPEFEGHGTPGSDCLLVSVIAPSPCTLAVLGNELARALGYPADRFIKESEVWQIVRRIIRDREIKFVHVDELQHVFATNDPKEVKKVRNTLKGLMQDADWPVWLIVSGLPECASLIDEDTQNWRRNRTVKVAQTTFEQDADRLSSMLASLCDAAGLMVGDEIATNGFIKRLIHASVRAFDISTDFTQDAIRLALSQSAAALKSAHFAAAYEARTGCGAERNIFSAEGDFRLIDPRPALFPSPEADEQPTGKKARAVIRRVG